MCHAANWHKARQCFPFPRWLFGPVSKGVRRPKPLQVNYDTVHLPYPLNMSEDRKRKSKGYAPSCLNKYSCLGVLIKHTWKQSRVIFHVESKGFGTYSWNGTVSKQRGKCDVDLDRQQDHSHILWETTLVDWGFWKAFSWLKAGGDPRVKLPFPWQNGQWLQISHLFFFFFRIYLFNVLVVVGLCCCTWAFSSCCMWVSHCSGFSCCRREALAPWALVVVVHGLRYK